jgi:hypothetical protein
VKSEPSSLFVRALFCASIWCVGGSGAEAQEIRAAAPAAALGVNALIGGITAGARAAFEHRNIGRAFAFGTLGGAMNYGGKWVASRNGDASGWMGTLIGATGTSIVVNAGAGAHPLSEITVPLPALRVRLRPVARKVDLSFHALDAWLIATNVGKAHTRINWARTAKTGAFVLETDREIFTDGGFRGGIALGPVLLMQGNDVGVWKHEGTHLQQWWFAQEAIGRPVENALKRRSQLFSWIPGWVDPGFVVPAMVLLDDAFFDYGKGLSNLLETEATLLERR